MAKTTQTHRAATFLDKGGTGKTTTTAHLGVALSQQGHNVLLIDLAGKQGDLAKQFGLWNQVKADIESGDAFPNVSTVFDEDWSNFVDRFGQELVDDLILDTGEGPDLIPAHTGLDSLDGELSQVDDVTDRYSRLDDFLTNYIDTRDYDIVLMDLPGLSNNVSYNGIWAAENVIAPVNMGPFEYHQADQLVSDLEKFGETFEVVNPELRMLIPNALDTRTRLDRDYMERFAEEYGDVVAPTGIPKSQDIVNATDKGQTVFALESPSSTAREAREAYLADAAELLSRLENGVKA